MVAICAKFRSRFIALCLLAVGGVHSPQEVMAAVPCRVLIDIGPTVECRDVTAPDFAKAHEADKIVEATFRMSVLLQTGRAEDLEELRVTILSSERRLRVVDFQPRTSLASELAGDIEVCATNDKTQSVNLTLGGTLNGQEGPVHAQISPSGGIGQTQTHGAKETFHRLSPKQLVMASGTTDSEHGVFFKWRRSSQAALEGSREVTVRFLVPRGWRGDWVQLGCESWTVHRNYLGEKLEPCGAAQAIVGLYLSGDDEAEQAANALVGARDSEEVAMRTQATAKKCNPADLLKLGSLFKPSASRKGKEQAAAREPSGVSNLAGETRAASVRANMPAALDAMRELSGR
ncbi:MAG TPA: hypothetical protein VGJ26_18465 [Pirellulales bacterium]|jgi:hypothetical protein